MLDASASSAAKRFKPAKPEAPAPAASNSSSGSPPAAHRPAAPPVKAACLFCRARKSKCDGKQPCKTCIVKHQECIYKASRRGAKRKHFDPAPVQNHLNELLGMSNLPHNVRVPGLVPQLRSYQQPVDLSDLGSYDLNALQAAIRAQQDVRGQSPAQPSSTFPAPAATLKPPAANLSSPNPLNSTPPATTQADYNALLSSALANMNVGNGQVQPALDTASTASTHAPPEQQQQQQQLLSWLMGGTTQQPALDTLPLGSESLDSAAPSSQGGLSAQMMSSLAEQVPQDLPLTAPLASIPATPPLTLQAEGSGASGPLPNVVPNVDPQTLPSGVNAPDSKTRARQLLTDFYLKLYAFIPVLLSPEYIETFVQLFGSHRSAFLLSLECLLPLLDENVEPEPVDGPDAFNSPARQRRRQTAAHYARLAGDAIDDVLETIEANADWGSLLEVLQALAVLAIYEYGSGRAVKARLRADQALGLAMSHGLHRLSSQSAFDSLLGARPPSSTGMHITEHFSPESLFEMSKRIWWVTWSLLMYASYNTGKLLTIRADDPRVTSALPAGSGQGQLNAWVWNILTLQTLLLVQDRVLALSQANDTDEVSHPSETLSPPWSIGLAEGSTSLAEASRLVGLAQIPSLVPPPPGDDSTRLSHQGTNPGLHNSSGPSSSSRRQIIESMVAIDKALALQIEQLEQQPLPWLSPDWPHRPADLSQVETGLVAYQRLGTGLQLYTAWLTLHLYSAFQGASLFERKLCFLSCVNDENAKSPPGAGLGGGTPGTTMRRSGSLGRKSLSPVPIPDAYSAIFSDQSAHASNLPTQGDNTDWLTANLGLYPDFSSPGQSAGDWLLHVAGHPTVDQSTGQLQPPATVGPADPPISTDDALVANSKPHASPGVFDARYSLDRCVYASKRLLEIMGHDELRANPFPSCSALLISYTLLMQVMSVSNDLIADLMADPSSDPSHNLLQSAQSSAALLSRPDGTLDPASKQERLAVLVDIWDKVRMAHDVLVKLARHYDMVVPMAQEVQVCLQTSQMLFDQDTLTDGLYLDADDALP